MTDEMADSLSFSIDGRDFPRDRLPPERPLLSRLGVLLPLDSWACGSRKAWNLQQTDIYLLLNST